MLLLQILLLAQSVGEGFPAEHRIGSVIEGVSPDVLLVREGENPAAELAYQPFWELYPCLAVRLAWRVRAGYVQKRVGEYISWQAMPRGRAVAERRLEARLIREGLLVLGELASAEEQRVEQWLLFPRLEGYQNSILTPAEWKVELDGKVVGRTFDSIEWITFSRDGRALGYLARQGTDWYAVANEKAWGPFSRADMLVLSPDGARAAFAAEKNGRWQMLLDGRPVGGEFSSVDWPVFSPNGKRLAFGAVSGTSARMVLDGQEGPGFDGVGEAVFSPDGRHLAYTARRTGEAFLLVNGEVKVKSDELRWPVWSPDGKRLALAARRGGDWRVICDSREQERFDEVGPPIFSPDSCRLAYRARKGVDWYMVADGKIDLQHPGASDPLFSASGASFAFTARSGTRQVVILDGKESPPFDWVGRLRFSSDGAKLGFGAQAGGETWWRVWDTLR